MIEIEAASCCTCGICEKTYHPNCIPAGSAHCEDGSFICCIKKNNKGTKRGGDKTLAPPRVLRSKSNSSVESEQSMMDIIPPAFQTYLDRQEQQNKDVNAKLDQVLNLNAKVIEIEKSVNILQTQVATLLCDRAKTSYEIRNCDLVISGLPELENENLSDLLKKIAQCLSVTMEARDLLSITRLPSRNHNLESSLAGTSRQSTDTLIPLINSKRPRTIMARLSNPGLRNNFIQSMKTCKKLDSTTIIPSATISRIYINEHLPPETLDLLKKARMMVRGDQNKFVYTYHGIVHYRPARGSPAVRINTEEDLQCINQ